LPTYTYKYLDDGTTFDVYQAFTDSDLTESADGRAVRKVFSPVGVSFSGSGFYRNDSRSENKSSDAAGKKTTSDSSPATSGESKSAPAAAPAAAPAPAAPSTATPSAKPAA
jgi:predicted nucleic acid-binding Zn ribbon protein